MRIMLPAVPFLISSLLLSEVVGHDSHRSNVASHEDGETIVRSFLPLGGRFHFSKIENNELLFFNVSLIGADEEINKAQLHLHRRRMSKLISHSHDRQMLPAPCRVILYQARSIESRPRRLTSLPVSPQTVGGWLPLDITAALREIHGRPLLLVVQFEGPKGVRLTIGNFLKPVKSKKNNSSPAYLVVFSKSDIDEGLDEPNERHLKHKERKVDGNVLANHIERNTAGGDVRHRSKHKIYEVKRSKQAALALQQRTRLQSLPFLHANEVADMRRSLRKIKRSVLGYSHQQSLHSNHKKASNKQGNLPKGCRRNRVEVPFTDGWILTPKSSSANICEGFCDIPDIMTIVNETSTNTSSQKGCCRSGKRSPLTMVIADGGHGLALHKVPGVLVEECVCAPCA